MFTLYPVKIDLDGLNKSPRMPNTGACATLTRHMYRERRQVSGSRLTLEGRATVYNVRRADADDEYGGKMHEPETYLCAAYAHSTCHEIDHNRGGTNGRQKIATEVHASAGPSLTSPFARTLLAQP